MNGLVDATNIGYTENGAIKRNTTKSALLDLFAQGAAMRNRSDADVILKFRNAFAEDNTYALKCLFYIRDVRGGQGERHFFRVAIKDLAKQNPQAVARNIENFPVYGRWDDLYCLVGTPCEKDAFDFIKRQLALDVQCKTPSLLAKWLKSENTSSGDSRALGNKTRIALGMSHKQYRKTLSILRARINVLERLMSAGKWDEIEFDKIPSRAGMIYKNAFARHDIERAKSEKNVQTFEEFAKDTTKKVNAKALYPYECVSEAQKYWHLGLDTTNRLMVNKSWDGLTDYFKGATLDALAVVDTSASMRSSSASAPINVAISLGMYCADKARGPFAGHYVSFSSRPQLVKVEGADFCDKAYRVYRTNLCENTNIEATFDMLLDTAVRTRCKPSDLPKTILILSDMEFDSGCGDRFGYRSSSVNTRTAETLMEGIARKWNAYGYELPHLVYWNLDARQDNIPMTVKNGVSFVSGFSPSILEQVMTNKTAFERSKISVIGILRKGSYARFPKIEINCFLPMLVK